MEEGEGTRERAMICHDDGSAKMHSGGLVCRSRYQADGDEEVVGCLLESSLQFYLEILHSLLEHIQKTLYIFSIL